MTFLTKVSAGLALCILAGCVTTTRSTVVDGRVVDVTRETRSSRPAEPAEDGGRMVVSADGRRAIRMEATQNPIHVAWSGNEAFVSYRTDVAPPADMVRQMVATSTGCRPGAAPVKVTYTEAGTTNMYYRLTCPG